MMNKRTLRDEAALLLAPTVLKDHLAVLKDPLTASARTRTPGSYDSARFARAVYAYADALVAEGEAGREKEAAANTLATMKAAEECRSALQPYLEASQEVIDRAACGKSAGRKLVDENVSPGRFLSGATLAELSLARYGVIQSGSKEQGVAELSDWAKLDENNGAVAALSGALEGLRDAVAEQKKMALAEVDKNNEASRYHAGRARGTQDVLEKLEYLLKKRGA